MKSTKLFAALAGVAMFAACSNEEIFKVETPQEMEEVVGAKLVGTNLSLNVSNGVETRYAEGKVGDFDPSDVIGLSWVVRGNALDDQTGADPNRDELFANHMFTWDGERFSTIGNIYQGWHFAYYPWTRMSKVGQKQFVVNPAQMKLGEGQDVRFLRTSQALHISQRHFVSDSDVQDDNTLDINFAVQPATNLISVNTTPAAGSTFVEGGDLAKAFAEEGKEVKIKEVVINLGEKVFADKLNLEITHDGTTSCLPAWDKDLSTEENAKVLREALYAETNPVLSIEGEKTEEVTTDVEAADYFVSDATQLKTIVIPGSIAINWENAAAVKAAREKVSIKVALTNGSYFLIKYVDGAEAGTSAAINNAEIDKLLKAYTAVEAKDWSKENLTGVFKYANNTQVNLNVELYGDIFNTDATFNNINSLDTWQAACDMATWLNREEQTFTLTGPVKFVGGEIPMPTNCEVTATYDLYNNRFNNKFFFTPGENADKDKPVVYGSMPEKLNFVDQFCFEVEAGVEFNAAHLLPKNNMQIVNRGTITVPEGKEGAINTVDQGVYAVVNYGTINVDPYACITKLENNGTVIIKWGAFVYPVSGKEGIIAYEVIDKDEKDPSRIAYLTANTESVPQTRLANVNTLIVGKDITLDFSKKLVDGGTTPSDNPYTPGDDDITSDEYANYGNNLANVDILVKDGGVIKSSNVGVVTSGGAITATTVMDVTLENGGYVDGGVIIAGDLKNTGAGIVKADYITGSVETNGDVVAAYISNGIVKAENCKISVENLTNGIKEATGCEITATTSITGNVTAEDCDIDAPEINGTVTLDGVSTVKNATITGDVTVESGETTLENVKIDGTLTVASGATVVLDSKGYIYITNIVNNGTLKANNDVFVTDVTLNPKSVTTLTDEDEAEMNWNKTIFYAGIYNNDKMTLNGAVLKYSIPSITPGATPEEMGTSATAALESAAKDAIVFLPEGTYEFGKTSQIDLEGASLICEPGTVINSAVNSAANKVLYYTLDDTKQVVLKNFTINAGVTKADIWFRNDNMKENGVVEIIIENVTCNHILFDFAYQNGTTATIKFINCKIGKVDVHANNATSTMNVEYDSASTINIIPGGTHTENVHVTKK